jgi:hypothetical protein
VSVGNLLEDSEKDAQGGITLHFTSHYGKVKRAEVLLEVGAAIVDAHDKKKYQYNPSFCYR